MKLTYEEKLQIVEDHKSYGTAYTYRKWGLSKRYVKYIVSKARNNALSSNNKHTNYSVEFKIMVAKAYAEGRRSFEEIAQLYGIKTLSTVKSWYDIYQSKGEEGLRNMKKTGRQKKDEVKTNKNKVNLDSLLSSDKEEYTKEEIKALKEELLRLRCHEEFSKKFEALAQDYLKKKNNK